MLAKIWLWILKLRFIIFMYISVLNVTLKEISIYYVSKTTKILHDLENLLNKTVKYLVYLVTLVYYIRQKQHSFEKMGTEKKKSNFYISLRELKICNLFYAKTLKNKQKLEVAKFITNQQSQSISKVKDFQSMRMIKCE